MNCPKCGTEIPYGETRCPECAEYIAQPKKQTKKDSTLSIVSCVLAGVSCFIFNWLAIAALICGLIDLCQKDDTKRHIGSIFGIVIGIISIFAIRSSFGL